MDGYIGPQIVQALLEQAHQQAPGVTDAELAWAIDQYSDRELAAFAEFRGDPTAVAALRRWAAAHRGELRR
jgi:hypothetical protein